MKTVIFGGARHGTVSVYEGGPVRRLSKSLSEKWANEVVRVELDPDRFIGRQVEISIDDEWHHFGFVKGVNEGTLVVSKVGKCGFVQWSNFHPLGRYRNTYFKFRFGAFIAAGKVDPLDEPSPTSDPKTLHCKSSGPYIVEGPGWQECEDTEGEARTLAYEKAQAGDGPVTVYAPLASYELPEPSVLVTEYKESDHDR